MIVLAMGIIPKFLSKVRTFVEIIKEKKFEKLVGLGSIFIMVVGAGFFPLKRDRVRKNLSPNSPVFLVIIMDLEFYHSAEQLNISCKVCQDCGEPGHMRVRCNNHKC